MLGRTKGYYVPPKVGLQSQNGLPFRTKIFSENAFGPPGMRGHPPASGGGDSQLTLTDRIEIFIIRHCRGMGRGFFWSVEMSGGFWLDGSMAGGGL